VKSISKELSEGKTDPQLLCFGRNFGGSGGHTTDKTEEPNPDSLNTKCGFLKDDSSVREMSPSGNSSQGSWLRAKRDKAREVSMYQAATTVDGVESVGKERRGSGGRQKRETGREGGRKGREERYD
jgi:hypothetical protein